jgi:hypothetical protein
MDSFCPCFDNTLIYKREKFPTKYLLQGWRDIFDFADRDMKHRILTSLPSDWSVNRIRKEFPSASKTIIKNARKLKREKGRFQIISNTYLATD